MFIAPIFLCFVFSVKVVQEFLETAGHLWKPSPRRSLNLNKFNHIYILKVPRCVIISSASSSGGVYEIGSTLDMYKRSASATLLCGLTYPFNAGQDFILAQTSYWLPLHVL